MPNRKQPRQTHKQRTKKPFYDPEKIKEIPILSVCELLNISVENKRYQRASCKARPERTASTTLYLDTNTFHDFGGGGAGGDVIAFYAYAAGVTQGDAIQALGQAFGITPIDPRAGLDPNELTHLDWKRIGLYGDRASKNFMFNVERLSPQRLLELSERYNISMNELRKKHPKTYERILKQSALPHVRALRNAYYLDVYNHYRFYNMMGRPDLFQDAEHQKELLKERDSLILAERILSKAVRGTKLYFQQCTSYEPSVVLKHLLRGEPELGTRTYKGMQAMARERGCFIRYRTMRLVEYQDADFSGIAHTAFVKGDRISIGYLPEDEEKIQEIMDSVKLCQEQSFSGDSSEPPKQALPQEYSTERDR